MWLLGWQISRTVRLHDRVAGNDNNGNREEGMLRTGMCGVGIGTGGMDSSSLIGWWDHPIRYLMMGLSSNLGSGSIH
jgi:hypothetical protein